MMYSESPQSECLVEYALFILKCSRVEQIRNMFVRCLQCRHYILLYICLGSLDGLVESSQDSSTRSRAAAMHDRVQHMSHTCSELVLSQACLGVSKVSHLLRSCGEELVEEDVAL